jgi:hypothetical protein
MIEDCVSKFYSSNFWKSHLKVGEFQLSLVQQSESLVQSQLDLLVVLFVLVMHKEVLCQTYGQCVSCAEVLPWSVCAVSTLENSPFF